MSLSAEYASFVNSDVLCKNNKKMMNYTICCDVFERCKMH